MKTEFLVDRQGKQFVLYAGLLDEAHTRGLTAIRTNLLQVPTPENGHTAIVQATVYLKDGGIFDGLGDANPGNVGRMIAGHIIRMAETRAKARALRDAINVGVTALEEAEDDEPTPQRTPSPPKPATTGPMPAQMNEFERHRVRLNWTADKLVGWVKSRNEGRGPRELTAEEAEDALNALGIIPTPGQAAPAQKAMV